MNIAHQARRFAALALTLPALAQAHGTGGVPHSHDTVSWIGFGAATALCYGAYLGLRHVLQRRSQQRVGRRQDRR